MQPAIALGLALQRAGHRVTIGAGNNFTAWIAGYGLDTAPMPLDMEQFMNDEDGKAWVASGQNPMQELRILKGAFTRASDDINRWLLDVIPRADGVLSGFTTHAMAATIAAHYQKPYIHTSLQPMLRTRSGWANLRPFVPEANSPLNLLAGTFAMRAMWHVSETAMRDLHDKLDIGPPSYSGFLAHWARSHTLLGVSPSVVPRPVDVPSTYHVSGYWFLEQASDYSPSDALAAFLDAGPPPVYIGFGSMSDQNGEDTAHTLLEALARTGVRGILARGWAGLSPQHVPDDVFLLDAAPHDWLFPRMRAVVHHGGAGTTAAAIRAGVPALVVPHFSDQPYWAGRVYALGVGAKPIPRHRLNVESLVRALNQLMTDDKLAQNARVLADKVRAEDGVSAALAVVESVMGER